MIPGLTTPLDPLHGDGYQFFSGLGGGTIVLAPLIAWWHHNNCTHKGCWRKGHKDPHHGHPLCRRHQPKLSPSQPSPSTSSATVSPCSKPAQSAVSRPPRHVAQAIAIADLAAPHTASSGRASSNATSTAAKAAADRSRVAGTRTSTTSSPSPTKAQPPQRTCAPSAAPVTKPREQPDR